MQDAKIVKKIATWAPSQNFIELYLRNCGTYRQSEKNLLSSNISSTRPHNMVNFSSLLVALFRKFGAPQLISTAFASWLHYCSDVAERKPTKLCTIFGRYLGWYSIHFGGCCSLTEFCRVQNSLCVLQVLRCPIGSVTARQSISEREPNFAALSTGCHVYSTGRPSRWALAHNLVAY